MVEQSIKTLRNTTASAIFISDVGISIDGYYTYSIPPQDYQYWAASEDVQPHLVDFGSLIAGDENAEITDGYFGLALLRDGIARQTAFDLDGYVSQRIFDAEDTNTQKAIEKARLLEFQAVGVHVADAYLINFGPSFNVIPKDGYQVEVRLKVQADVSPGFTWGDSGNNKNTYLLNDTVPSNLAGRVVPDDGIITTVTVSLQNIASAGSTVEIRSRSGIVFTTLVVVPLSTTSRVTVFSTFINVAGGTELSCYAGNIGIFGPVVSVAVAASNV